MSGKTANGKQRFYCRNCSKWFVWKSPNNKINNEKTWFIKWIKGKYRVNQLVELSGYSRDKINRIKNYWLNKEPPLISNADCQKIKYLFFDATNFHKTGCLLLFINALNGKVISCQYADSESYKNVYKSAFELKQIGIMPKVIISDGAIASMKAISKVWDGIVFQRCLFHIERQVLSWLRAHPKEQSGRHLREIVKHLSNIKTKKDKNSFIKNMRLG